MEREGYGDKAKHKGGHHNPVEHGYGLGRNHCEKTEYGQHVAGGSGPHTYDKNMQNIGGGKGLGTGEKGGEHESKQIRSHDNPRSDDRQPHGKHTGEGHLGTPEHDIHTKYEVGEHIAGGSHEHHEHGSGKAEHHPSVSHREAHHFSKHSGSSHGFGHGVHQRQGHLRMSGASNSHRIGSRKK